MKNNHSKLYEDSNSGDFYLSKKIKIELIGENGKISLTLEGEAATSQKLVNVVQSLQPLIDNRGTSPEVPVRDNQFFSSLEKMSKKDRIKHIIRSALKHGWFNSKDVFELYTHYIDGEIGLSTVSTNLSRLQKDNILERRGNGSNIEYRLQQDQLEKIPEITLVSQAH